MCKCTPEIKTPFCGAIGCEWPAIAQTVSIGEWFDVKSGDHLEAYDHLCKTGAWPEGFVPDHVQRHPGWHMHLVAKMANAWVDYRLGRL